MTNRVRQQYRPPCDADGTCLVNVLVDPPGFELRVPVWSFQGDLQNQVMTQTERVWEWDWVRWLIRRFAQWKPGVLVDIGANIGAYSLPVAAWMKASWGAGRVIAFEVQANVSKLLTRSAVASDLPIDVYHLALADRAGGTAGPAALDA